MRGEQLHQCGEGSANPSQILIHQLKEITGIHDLQLLQEALKASQGDMGQAIALLTSQEAEEEKQTGAVNPTGDRPKDDLQAAIELSLQESQKTQDEERQLNRALEVSAEESASRSKPRRPDALPESSSPADWIRLEDWPVGMRNVGNTCWFSAVIQSLFHLPVFRRLVLNYHLSQSLLEKCKTQSDKRNVAFMQELRCLFALMLGSKRKFVDPSAAVELLKDAFRTSEAQQDVSEFTHKLLDWLEDAFQLAANGSNPEDKQQNPMVQLFYGTFVAERTREGTTQSNIEPFGQYPLQVNGFNNLDECLEGAMVEGEIELLHSDQTVHSGRQRWFSKLPPVLTFELSRFEFNQSLGRPEKIHKKLEFPQVVYMDRYLHKNMEQTQGRREEVKRLKEQLTVLQQRLESYKSYGSGPAKYPLADMLQYVLEFASTKPSSISPVGPVTTPSPLESEESGLSDSVSSESTSTQRTPIHKPFTQCRQTQQWHQHPAPHSVTDEELLHIRACLQRWRVEVENDINELKSSIESITQSLEAMYTDGMLCQVPYRLHAVLVHEGQASAGHYWAYIYDHTRRRWLKYNDVSVTVSSWEELERDSYGGMTNASAYCLMYIDDKLPHLIAEDTDDETGQVLNGMDSLPQILRCYVREDNRQFQQELREWEEQFCQPAQEELLRETHVTDVKEATEPTSLQPVSDPTPEPIPEPQPDGFSPDQPALLCSPEPPSKSPEMSDPAINEDAVQTEETPPAQESEVVEKQVVDEEEKTGDDEVKVEGEIKTDGDTEDEVPASEEYTETHPESEAQATPQLDTPSGEHSRQLGNQVSEVEIPNVGKISLLSDADGYNEEEMLTPAMQGVIMAIAKARQAFDKDGPEAGLIKAFHEEYSRLHQLSQEETTPQNDPRLQHVLVYLFQNRAPDRIIERALLEQFADRNLRYDERSISIMKEARTKLRLIKPEDMDMEEYMKWHEDYSLFRKVFVYLLTGLEQYQNGRLAEALNYLVYAHQNNTDLLQGGQRKGVEQSLITLYRRRCLKELNERASTLFKSGQENDVEEGVAIVNDVVIPCMHLMTLENVSKEDLDAVEAMRSHWCSYLGQEMDDALQEKLGEFLPRLLDCSADRFVLSDPPKVRQHLPHDLCSRLAAVMESIRSSSVVTVT